MMTEKEIAEQLSPTEFMKVAEKVRIQFAQDFGFVSAQREKSHVLVTVKLKNGLTKKVKV